MATPQWTADIDIDATLAADAIVSQFPAFASARIEAFGQGWDNAAFLVDGRVLFRFPRRRLCAALIDREIAFLPAIADRVPLPISAPAYAGTATEAYPWRFAGYELLRGTTACSRSLTDAERANLAIPLAGFLRAVHAIDAAPLLARGLPPDELGRLDHAKRLKASQARVATILASGLVDDIETFVLWLANNPAVTITDGQRAFVHGDLYARHLLLDDDARLSGVIDWGDLHFGDPAIDLSIAHMMLPESAHEAFRTAYGAIDERTWKVARYRAIYHAILEIEYGIREDDVGMRRAGIEALALIREAVSRDETVDRLIASWNARSISLSPPVSPAELHITETRIAAELPVCLRRLYERTAGTHEHYGSGRTFEQSDWYQVLPPSEIFVSEAYPELLVFCDYMLASLFYGVAIARPCVEFESGAVYRISVTDHRNDTFAPVKVAESIERFLALAMDDHLELLA